MNDLFSGGTPWDDAPSTPPARGKAGKQDFNSETPWDAPKAKRPVQGPIFQGYGQKAKKIKTPKAPKARKVDTGEPVGVLFEKVVRGVWRTLRVLRTASIVLFVFAIGLLTFAFARGASGDPWVFVATSPVLGLDAGVHQLAPLMGQLVALALAATVAGVVAVNVAKPHGRFREFTSRSWIWAVVAVVAFPLLTVFLTMLLDGGLTSLAHALPDNFRWVFDPTTAAPVGHPASVTGVVTPAPSTVPTP